jgi:hypothetical protein
VDITKDDFYLVLLENDQISYDDYVKNVTIVPKEYASYELFLKNKGKVSKRIKKQGEWLQEGLRNGIIPDHWK